MIKNLARANFTDLIALNKTAPAFLGCKRNLPLCIGQRLFLIPFSLRAPQGKNDGTLGYFNDDFIEDICLCPRSQAHYVRLVGEHKFYLRKKADFTPERLQKYRALRQRLMCKKPPSP